MPLARLAACSLALPVLFAAPDAARAHDSACFPAASRDTIARHAPQLQAMNDQLVRTVSSQAGASNETTYLLMRQTLLIERIHRGVETHAGSTCATALDRIKRDFEMLSATWKAYAQGDTALEVAPLASKPAQDALGDIESALPPFAEAVAALEVAAAGP
jgi:hypothetical protein